MITKYNIEKTDISAGIHQLKDATVTILFIIYTSDFALFVHLSMLCLLWFLIVDLGLFLCDNCYVLVSQFWTHLLCMEQLFTLSIDTAGFSPALTSRHAGLSIHTFHMASVYNKVMDRQFAFNAIFIDAGTALSQVSIINISCQASNCLI